MKVTFKVYHLSCCPTSLITGNSINPSIISGAIYIYNSITGSGYTFDFGLLHTVKRVTGPSYTIIYLLYLWWYQAISTYTDRRLPLYTYYTINVVPGFRRDSSLYCYRPVSYGQEMTTLIRQYERMTINFNCWL